MIWRENDKNKRQKKKKYDKKMTEIDRQSQMEYSVQRKEKQMYTPLPLPPLFVSELTDSFKFLPVFSYLRYFPLV